MKITAVKALILHHRYNRKVELAHMTMTGRTLGLVQIETDAEITGWGEFDVLPTGDKVILNLVEDTLAPLLIGEDPTAIGRLNDKLTRYSLVMGRTRSLETYAIGAVDMALWDIVGKSVNKPVSHLLGHYRESIPAYASLGYEADPEKLAETVDSWLKKGFSGVKIRIGLEPEKDEVLVKAAREAAGDRTLMADVNAGWRRSNAISRGRVLDPYRLAWLEEPLPVYDTPFVADLAAALDTPIALGEHHLFNRADAIEMIREGTATIFQPDLRVGITECAAIAAIGSAAGIPFVPHCFAGAVRFSAALQVLGGVKEVLFAEFLVTGDPLFEELCEPSFELVNGEVLIPQGPGLGVEPKPDQVSRFEDAAMTRGESEIA